MDTDTALARKVSAHETTSKGLAARSISGYIKTLPRPGQEKLQGADASHLHCPDQINVTVQVEATCQR